MRFKATLVNWSSPHSQPWSRLKKKGRNAPRESSLVNNFLGRWHSRLKVCNKAKIQQLWFESWHKKIVKISSSFKSWKSIFVWFCEENCEIETSHLIALQSLHFPCCKTIICYKIHFKVKGLVRISCWLKYSAIFSSIRIFYNRRWI